MLCKRGKTWLKYKLYSTIYTTAKSSHPEVHADFNTHLCASMYIHSARTQTELNTLFTVRKNWKKVFLFTAVQKCLKLCMCFLQRELKKRGKKVRGIKKIWGGKAATMEKHMETPVLKVVYVRTVFGWRLIGVIIEAGALPALTVPQYTFSTTPHYHYVPYVCFQCKVHTHTHTNKHTLTSAKRESHSATSQWPRHVCKPLNVPPGQVDTHAGTVPVLSLLSLSVSLSFIPEIINASLPSPPRTKCVVW